MRLLDFSFEDPAENLALDEVLLDTAERVCEEGLDAPQPDVLRFWESPTPFVVLGTAQVLRQEAHEENCQRDGVPILRRCSAGGCVLQGPGSLNYTLVLTYHNWPDVRSLRDSYCFILTRLAEALHRRGIGAGHAGICDLAIGGRKVSGNAQRRRRHAILHHGALLYQPDFDGMARYLQEPQDRPDYRGQRSHAEFVQALPLTPEQLKAAVVDALDAGGAEVALPTRDEITAAKHLAETKYRDPKWTHRR